MSYLETIQSKRQQEAAKTTRQAEFKQSLDITKAGSDTVAKELIRQHARDRQLQEKTKIDVQGLFKALVKIDASVKENGEVVTRLLDGLPKALDRSEKGQIKTQAKQDKVALDAVLVAVKASQHEITAAIKEVVTAIANIEVAPDVTVEAPIVNVPEQTTEVNVDLQPLLASVQTLKKSIEANKIKIPETDLSGLETAMRAVKKAIDSQVFPVPNYVLPFKDSTGKAVQALVDSNDYAQFSKAKGTTSITTQVGDSATVVTLKAANTSRIKLVIVNTSSAVLYVKEGSGATIADWTYKLNNDDTTIIDDYSGIVTGIWASDAGGGANVTETT